jgi:DNA-binding SARP family transcriptional activator
MNQWQEAMDTWRTLLQTDPTFEGAYQNMMILYADTGRKKEAIQVFNTCRAVLKTELDAEPDPETLDLYEKIKNL